MVLHIMDKKAFNGSRRKRLADLVTQKREGMGMTQREFCDWLVIQGQNAQSFGAFIEDLTYGALQSWENPAQRGKLPSVDNVWLLHKVLGFTSIDQFVLFLGTGQLKSSLGEVDLTPQQIKTKVLNMDKAFQVDLLKTLQAMLIA